MKRTLTTTHTARRMQRPRHAVVAAVLAVLAACGGGDDGSQQGSAPGDTSAVSQSTSSPTTTAPSDSAPTAATTTPPPTTTAPGLADFESQVEEMLAASLEPGFYTRSAPDLPPDSLPSGTSVGIRVPGQPDLIVGVGTEAVPPDAAFDPAAPFAVGAVTTNMVYALYYMLVEDGTLDPTTTLATWLPSYPNADQITLDMVSDFAGLHGMAALDNWVELVTADYTRQWTLDEVLAEAAALPAGAVGEGGSAETATAALLFVLEESTGMSFDELLETRLVQPLGLSETTVIDPDQMPADFSHGRYNFPGQGALTTADAPLDAYYSFKVGESVLSTVADQLAIAEALATGTVPGLGLLPTPNMFPSDREVTDEDGTRYFGDGFPLNLHCPCQAVGDGQSGASIGRRGNALGTTTHWYHFPSTGITIVVHLNSFEAGTPLEVMELAYAIHELVSGEPTPSG